MLHLLFYLIMGAISGLLSGLLGIGGGLIIVPLLTFYFSHLHFPGFSLMHVVIGTSLGAMVTTTFFSSWAHYKLHPDILTIFKKMVGFVMIGVIVGSIVTNYLHSDILKKIFGIFACNISLLFFFDPTFTRKHLDCNPRTVSVFSFFIGFFSMLFGIGGGAIGLPFITRYMGIDMHRAIGIAALLSVSVSLFGLIGYWYTGRHDLSLPPFTIGYIYWPAVVGINLTSPFFVFLGAKFAEKTPVRTLRQIFAVILFFMGLEMVV